MEKLKKNRLKKYLKRIGITIGILLALIFIAIGVALNFVFTPEKLTPMVRDIAQEYITTDFDVKSVELTFFSTFPDFAVKIDSLVVNLPCDTLAPLLFAQECVASISPFALLDNEVVVNRLTLQGADINLYVDSLVRPFKIFKFPSDSTDTAEQDSLEQQGYSFSLDKIEILNSSIVVDDRTKNFYSQLDSLNLELSAQFYPEIINLDMVLDMPYISIINGEETLASEESLFVDTQMEFNRDSLILTIPQAELRVNTIDLRSRGELRADSSYTEFYVDLDTRLTTPSISEFLKLIPSTLIDSKESLTTEGTVDMVVALKGEFSESSKPSVSAKLQMENVVARYASRKVSIEDIDCDVDLFLDFNEPKNSYTTIDHFKINSTDIVNLSLAGSVSNIFEDPFFDLNVVSDIDFNRFSELFPLQNGVSFNGYNKSNLSAKMNLSDITESNYGAIYLDGESVFSEVVLAIDGSQFMEDSTATGFLYLDVKQGNLLFGEKVNNNKNNNNNDNNKKNNQNNKARRLVSTVDFSDIGFRTRDGEFVLVENLKVTAGANLDNKTQEVNGFRVSMNAQNVDMGIEDELDVMLKATEVTLNVSPKSKKRSERIAATLSSDSVVLFEYANNSELTLSRASMEYQLTKEQGDKKWSRAGEVGFSDFYMYSDMFPLDVRLNKSRVAVADNVIKLSNTQIRLGQSNLVVTGSVSNFMQVILQNVNMQRQSEPQTPQRNQRNQQQGQRNNSQNTQNQQKAQEKSMIEGNLTIRSRLLDVTELMQAVNMSVLVSDSTYTDEQQEVEVVVEQRGEREAREYNIADNRARRDSTIRQRRDVQQRIKRQPEPQGNMFLVPKNIKFDLNLDLAKVLYESGSIDSVVGRASIDKGIIELKELSLRAIGAQARTSVVYQNLNNRRSRLYLDLTLSQVDINRVGELLPAVDSLMPMMKSFEGLVDFDMRAVGMVNSKSGFNPATMRAAIDVSGRNLVLMDSETFADLSKLLMFKNKDRNLIDSLSVLLTADSSRVDVLPFYVTIDRYEAIVGGTQTVDSTYNVNFDYNVSIMKSPLPFKAGVDVKGDLEDFDFDVTRAKLKKTDFEAQNHNFREFMESIK
ncbi:MAG: hypothetical protein R3Y49_01955 [Rikenellaceae bacterium]